MKEPIVIVEVMSKYFLFRYMAPEMILKLGHDKCVDFYGLGALLYEMIYGFPPFYNQNVELMMQHVV